MQRRGGLGKQKYRDPGKVFLNITSKQGLYYYAFKQKLSQ